MYLGSFVQVTDFGLAKFLPDDDACNSTTTTIRGTFG